MTSEERALLLRLASRIPMEKDPDKFSSLIAELNQLLARTEDPMGSRRRNVEGRGSARA
jgi:hypothetical protein